MRKVLIVEDDLNIAEMTRLFLSKSGYSCKVAADGAEAASIVEQEYFDLVLLDVMLPLIDGFELIPYIKQYGIPVIFVTARTGVEDRIRGLKLGADDYILKPFDLKELAARIEVVLRRYGGMEQIIFCGTLEINVPSHSVKKDGQSISLTVKEFDLLVFFITHPNIVLQRETIYEHVWKEPYYGNTRTIDLHVQRIKKKLGLEGRIHTIYKLGYLFQKEDDVS